MTNPIYRMPSRVMRKGVVSKYENSPILLFIAAVLLCSPLVYGQDTVTQVPFKISYEDSTRNSNDAAIFLNDVYIGGWVQINPEKISKVSLQKTLFIDGESRYGKQIHLYTKPDYHPHLISLSNLVEEHTRFGKRPFIVYIDEAVIDADYARYYLDKNTIQRIIIAQGKASLSGFGILRIVTNQVPVPKKQSEIVIKG